MFSFAQLLNRTYASASGSIQVILSLKYALGDVIGYAQNQEESLRLFLEQDERPMNSNLFITAFAKADQLDTSCE